MLPTVPDPTKLYNKCYADIALKAHNDQRKKHSSEVLVHQDYLSSLAQTAVEGVGAGNINTVAPPTVSTTFGTKTVDFSASPNQCV